MLIGEPPLAVAVYVKLPQLLPQLAVASRTFAPALPKVMVVAGVQLMVTVAALAPITGTITPNQEVLPPVHVDVAV
jgi:hypothetical protein